MTRRRIQWRVEIALDVPVDWPAIRATFLAQLEGREPPPIPTSPPRLSRTVTFDIDDVWPSGETPAATADRIIGGMQQGHAGLCAAQWN